MKQIITFLIFSVIFFASGLTQAGDDIQNSSLVDKEALNFSNKYLAELSRGNIDYVWQQTHSDLKAVTTRANLAEIGDSLNRLPIKATKLIGFNQISGTEGSSTNLTYEFELDGQWLILVVRLKKDHDELKLIALQTQLFDAAVKEKNRLTFQDKSPRHYLMALYAMTVPVFMLVTFVVCIRTRIPKRKWLWCLWVLLGVGSLSLNWADGQFDFRLLHLMLLGTGISAWGDYMPPIVSVGFPLGALMFWAKRQKWMSESVQATSGSQGEAAPIASEPAAATEATADKSLPNSAPHSD